MASPQFSINGNAVGVKARVSPGGAIVATLDDISGVSAISWTVANVDDESEVGDYAITPSGSIGQIATLAAAGPGTAGELKCRINSGVNLATGNTDLTVTEYSVKWWVPVAGDSGEVFVLGEIERENRLGSATHGILAALNALVRVSGGVDAKASVKAATAAALTAYNEGDFAQVWQVDATGPTFVDLTTAANNATDADFEPFLTGAGEAVGDWIGFGLATPFSRAMVDYLNGTAGVGGTVAWEYSTTGDTWTALADVVDDTTGFTAAAADDLQVSWTVPTDWVARAENGSASLYWVRARVTGTYSTNPVIDQVRACTSGQTLTAVANGALAAVDGVTLAQYDRVLVTASGAATGADVGIYYVEDVGAGGAPWILRRAPDADEGSELTPQTAIRVEQGAKHGATTFYVSNTSAVVVGTTAITLTGGTRILPYSITAVKTATYTAAIGELVRVDPSGGAFAVNLPTAVNNDNLGITIKNVANDATAVTITPDGSETVDGQATTDLALAYGVVTVISDGTNWLRFPAA